MEVPLCNFHCLTYVGVEFITVIYLYILCLTYVGVLTVDSEAGLDYENSPTVVVTVEAQDSVSNPLSSTTTITIHVMDVNDVVPVFKKKDGYSESVDENEPAGTLISDTIEASDEDTGLGGVITYSIVSTNPSGYLDKFSINSTTG